MLCKSKSLGPQGCVNHSRNSFRVFDAITYALQNIGAACATLLLVRADFNGGRLSAYCADVQAHASQCHARRVVLGKHAHLKHTQRTAVNLSLDENLHGGFSNAHLRYFPCGQNRKSVLFIMLDRFVRNY